MTIFRGWGSLLLNVHNICTVYVLIWCEIKNGDILYKYLFFIADIVLVIIGLVMVNCLT